MSMNHYLVDEYHIEYFARLPIYDFDTTNNGWVVYKNTGTCYEHTGYIFDTREDAENYTKGILPEKYIKINWKLFPSDKCYEVISR